MCAIRNNSLCANGRRLFVSRREETLSSKTASLAIWSPLVASGQMEEGKHDRTVASKSRKGWEQGRRSALKKLYPHPSVSDGKTSTAEKMYHLIIENEET